MPVQGILRKNAQHFSNLQVVEVNRLVTRSLNEVLSGPAIQQHATI